MFHYNTRTIRTWSQPLHIPTSAFRPLKYNCSYHGIHINISITNVDVDSMKSSSAANTHWMMGKAHPHRMLAVISQTLCFFDLTHRKYRGKPDIRILPPLLQKNKYGRSQLYRDQIFSHTIYVYNRKFDWCLIIHPIWLVKHTSLTDLLTDPLTEPPITYPTRLLRGIFLQKNNSIK